MGRESSALCALRTGTLRHFKRPRGGHDAEQSFISHEMVEYRAALLAQLFADEKIEVDAGT